MSALSTSWLVIAGIAATALGVLIFSRYALGTTPVEPWVKNLAIAQTMITILAALVAGSWYFVERPRAAKIKIDQSAVGVPLPSGDILILAEVTLTNLGQTSLDLRGDVYNGYVQQVTPLLPRVRKEIGATEASGTLRIYQEDNWGALASIEEKLPSFLEAAEVENLYFHTVIACQPGLRVYYTSEIQKPPQISDKLMNMGNMKWIKESFIDLAQMCKTPITAPHHAGRSKSSSTPRRRIHR